MLRSRFTISIIYIVTGILFMFLAITSAKETIWNGSTIIFSLIATYDFYTGIRILKTKNRSAPK